MKLASLTREQIDGILDLWARGDTTREIGARFNMDWRDVSVVAKRERDRGDPRAVSRIPLSATIKNKDDRNREMLEMHQKGISSTEIGKTYNMCAGSVRKVLSTFKARNHIVPAPTTWSKAIARSKAFTAPRLFQVVRGTGDWSCLLIYVPINRVAHDHRKELVERILTMWVDGFDMAGIATATNVTANVVKGIVTRARAKGDPRAVDRTEKSRFKIKDPNQDTNKSPETVSAGEPQRMPKDDYPPVMLPVVRADPSSDRLPRYKPAPVTPVARSTTGKRSLTDIERELEAAERALRDRLVSKTSPSVNGGSLHNGTSSPARRFLTQADRREHEKIPEDFVSSGKTTLFDPDNLPPYGQRMIIHLKGPSDSGPGDCKYPTDYRHDDVHRHRFCGRPAVHPHSYCAEHALLVINWNNHTTPGERLRLQLLCEAA